VAVDEDVLLWWRAALDQTVGQVETAGSALAGSPLERTEMHVTVALARRSIVLVFEASPDLVPLLDCLCSCHAWDGDGGATVN
jgi:hypothetical protein